MNDWKGAVTHRSLVSYLLPLCRNFGRSHNKQKRPEGRPYHVYMVKVER
jgi:hypothetical protein